MCEVRRGRRSLAEGGERLYSGHMIDATLYAKVVLKNTGLDEM